MKEIWKDIKGYEGQYQVNNYGNVRSLSRIIQYPDGRQYNYKGRELKPHRNKKGYYTITLSKDSVKQHYQVHRLVAEAFIGDIPEGYVVNHINCIPSDNRAENLEIVTQTENVLHSARLGHFDGINEDKYKVFFNDGTSIVFNSGKELTSTLGMHRSSLWRIINGSSQRTARKLNIRKIVRL